MLLLAGGGFGLLMGVWTGLARADVHSPFGPVADHGVVMVLGFLGTLIALERAVALGRGWGYLAPALAGASTVWLVAGLPRAGAGLALTTAGLIVVLAYATMLRQHVEAYLLIMTAGGVAWVLAAGLWTSGWGAIRITPLLAAFLVLTIIGERVELSRLRFPSRASQRRLLVAIVVFAGGVLLTLVSRRAGLVVAGIGLIGQTAWLWRNDIARITVRRDGLPRFSAACLLAGYVWLAVAGALWMALGVGIGGSLLHDAAMHALFLGFVMSMVMGHAPIILPAVLAVPLPHRGWAWVPLVLLHASVALRVGADLAGSAWLRGWAAHGNVTALLLFVGLSALTVRLAWRTSTPADPVLRGAT